MLKNGFSREEYRILDFTSRGKIMEMFTNWRDSESTRLGLGIAVSFHSLAQQKNSRKELVSREFFSYKLKISKFQRNGISQSFYVWRQNRLQWLQSRESARSPVPGLRHQDHEMEQTLVLANTQRHSIPYCLE